MRRHMHRSLKVKQHLQLEEQWRGDLKQYLELEVQRKGALHDEQQLVVLFLA